MKYDISIIVPSFNRVAYLPETLRSLFDQTLQPCEIIVVDDHSVDGTKEYLKKNFGGKVVVVENRGKGPGAARNTGLSAATGNFIKFFDSDDVMSSNTLEAQCARLINGRSGFVYSPYIRAMQTAQGKWVPTDRVILNFHPFDKRYQLNYWMLRGLFLAIPSMLFKRELLEEVGPWPEVTAAYEDWEYLWRIGLVEPDPVHTSECVFLYRQHGEQITQGHSDHLRRDKEAVLVLENVLSMYLQRYSKSPLERILLKTKIYSILKNNRSNAFFREKSSAYSEPVYNAMVCWWRVVNKLQRLQTRSQWVTCCGPDSSVEQLDKFMALFD